MQRNTWIVVENKMGDDLYITKSGMEAARGKLTVVSFTIGNTSDDLRNLLKDRKSSNFTEQLIDLSVDISKNNY